MATPSADRRPLPGTLGLRSLAWTPTLLRASETTNQAAQFARGVPDFVLRGRFADVVRLDLEAVEKEMNLPVEKRRGFWRRLLHRR